MYLLTVSNQPLVSAYFEADFFGKCIFLSLLALSLLCWITLIYKTMQVNRIKRGSAHFLQLCSTHREELLLYPIDKKLASHGFGQIFSAFKQKVLDILSKNRFFSEDKESVYLTKDDLELVESYVLTTISVEAKRLEKNLFILTTITSLAPFFGLLGTVWGILVAFAELPSGGAASSNTAILGGLSTALATTVLGLIIAIPALIAHNCLKNGSRSLVSDMEDFLYTLLSTVELQYRRPS